MLTENSIVIKGDTGKVFEIAADILGWPKILPHYRYVRLLENRGRKRLVEMAAHRDGIPVKWVSLQEPIPEQNRILFQHVGGPVKGMEVEWLLKEDASLSSPAVLVSISHSFKPPWPVVGHLVAEYLIGRFFISNIAGKTLAGIKRVVEG